VVSRTLLLLAVLLAAGSPARAQDAQDDSRALYEEGSRAYKAGDYPRAIEKFLAAYDLSHAPAILFNIAQAYRLAGRCDRALEYYRRSLDEEPAAANRDEVEERIAEMQACADEAARQERDEKPAPEMAAASAPPPSTVELATEEPEPPAARRSLLPLLTVGVGATAAVAGGIIYLQARAKFDEVEASCPCEPGSFSGWETATDASYVLMGAGVVAAGAGLVWWWQQSRSGRPQRVSLVPTARGIGWAGSF
jgi:tetratricopeptide (TPR) repeat protein